MAFSLLTLIDDVASLLDDVAIMTKIAAKKTSGVIGDDLALNAQQLNGIDPNQELPIIYAVAKGSFINKAILVPIALLISAFIPFLVTPLLMIGGAFLCFEGVEKLIEKFLHKKEKDATQINQEERIKGAIRTDFILSAEIIVIALGTMANAPIINQIITLSIIGIGMNFGVYGFVALIIKLDDLGLYLKKYKNIVANKLGTFLIVSAPMLMKSLGVIGTTAMFLVGGGIISHGFHFIGDSVEKISSMNPATQLIISMSLELFVGIITGLIVVGLYKTFNKIRKLV